MLYDYDACLLLLYEMVQQAQKDTESESDRSDAYLFLWWCRVYLVGYIEDLKEE